MPQIFKIFYFFPDAIGSDEYETDLILLFSFDLSIFVRVLDFIVLEWIKYQILPPTASIPQKVSLLTLWSTWCVAFITGMKLRLHQF